MRGFFLLALFLSFYFGMPPAIAVVSPTASDQSTSTPHQQTPHCGATVADDVNQARQSLASNSANSEHDALACLIEAIDRINTDSLAAIRSDGDRVLSVPTTTKAPMVKP